MPTTNTFTIICLVCSKTWRLCCEIAIEVEFSLFTCRLIAIVLFYPWTGVNSLRFMEYSLRNPYTKLLSKTNCVKWITERSGGPGAEAAAGRSPRIHHGNFAGRRSLPRMRKVGFVLRFFMLHFHGTYPGRAVTSSYLASFVLRSY